MRNCLRSVRLRRLDEGEVVGKKGVKNVISSGSGEKKGSSPIIIIIIIIVVVHVVVVCSLLTCSFGGFLGCFRIPLLARALAA